MKASEKLVRCVRSLGASQIVTDFTRKKKPDIFISVLHFVFLTIVVKAAIIGSSRAAAIVSERPISALLPPTFSMILIR